MPERNTKPKIEKKTPKKITETYLQNSGLYYLQRFPASRCHFQFIMNRKIQRSLQHHDTPSKEDAQKLLEKVTAYFEDLGFLNDTKYAQGYTRSLFRKGYSQARIIYTLKNKGIDPLIISECLETSLPKNAELIAAMHLLKRRRYGVFATREDKKDPQKAMKLLARSGFSYQIAEIALKTSLDDINEILSDIS